MLTLTYFPPGPGATPIAFTKVSHAPRCHRSIEEMRAHRRAAQASGSGARCSSGCIRRALHLIGLSIATLAMGATAPSFRSP